jgi:hypothetical protein
MRVHPVRVLPSAYTAALPVLKAVVGPVAAARIAVHILKDADANFFVTMYFWGRCQCTNLPPRRSICSQYEGHIALEAALVP